MRTGAGMSSLLVPPTGGWRRRPSTVSRAHFWMYSCARWTGLRVWKPTTVRQPRSTKAARAWAGAGRDSAEAAAQQHFALGVQRGDARVGVLGRAIDLLRFLRLVVVEPLLQLQHRQRLARLVGERPPLPPPPPPRPVPRGP